MTSRVKIAAACVVTMLLAPAAALASPNPSASNVSTAVVTGHPALGYNTWYQYRTAANEADVLAQAHEMISTGLVAAGYDTVNLDDGWMTTSRDSSGNLVADPVKFPHGMASLASQLRAMGLKLGMYEAIGTRTCQGYPGSYGHYAQDAALFTSWQVDYVKIDACGGYPSGTTESSLAALYTQFGGDLRADNPYMLYSQELPVPYIGTSYFLPAVSSSSKQSNSWRISPDEYGKFTTVIVRSLNADIHLHAYAHSGHWNDLDLVLPRSIMPSPSNSAYLTYEQTQLSGWAMEASPILISADLASLSAAELAALKNSDMIAIDASGAQSAKVVVYAHVDAFVKPAEGGTAVFLVNMGTGIASAVFTMTQLGLPAVANWRNIWTGRTGTARSIKITLNPGASTMVIFK